MEHTFQFQVSLGRLSGKGWGTLRVHWNPRGLLTKIHWDQSEPRPDQPDLPPYGVADLADRLQNYFAFGSPLGEVPWEHIEQVEWTQFQSQVYRAIARIPHGETRTYGWVAERVGKPLASRAVGQALKGNPLPLVIPCHRVVATNSIGGFMGRSDPSNPELQLKRELLLLEEAYLNPVFSFLNAFDSAARPAPRLAIARAV